MAQHCRDLRGSTELVVSVVCGKQGSFQHWGAQIHYLTAFMMLSAQEMWNPQLSGLMGYTTETAIQVLPAKEK